MGERPPCKREVVGSTPTVGTKLKGNKLVSNKETNVDNAEKTRLREFSLLQAIEVAKLVNTRKPVDNSEAVLKDAEELYKYLTK